MALAERPLSPDTASVPAQHHPHPARRIPPDADSACVREIRAGERPFRATFFHSGDVFRALPPSADVLIMGAVSHDGISALAKV